MPNTSSSYKNPTWGDVSLFCILSAILGASLVGIVLTFQDNPQSSFPPRYEVSSHLSTGPPQVIEGYARFFDAHVEITTRESVLRLSAPYVISELK